MVSSLIIAASLVVQFQYNGSGYSGPFGTLAQAPEEERVILHSAQLMMQMNSYRQERHLPPVDYALYLEAEAMTNNAEQVAMGSCEHYVVRSNRHQLVCHQPNWSAAWEAWIKEPSNRAIIENPRIKRIGYASYRYYHTMNVEESSDLSVPMRKNGEASKPISMNGTSYKSINGLERSREPGGSRPEMNGQPRERMNGRDGSKRPDMRLEPPTPAPRPRPRVRTAVRGEYPPGNPPEARTVVPSSPAGHVAALRGLNRREDSGIPIGR